MTTTQIAPFDGAPGVWVRCALHSHTTETDGWLTPPMLRRYHAWSDYGALAITDHDRYVPHPEGDDDLIMLGGVEISLVSPKSQGPLHLLGIGVERMPNVTRESTLREAALAVKAAGGIPFVAHPLWTGLRTDEVDGIEECAGIEIYNSSCEVEQDRAHSDTHWDIWLSMGHKLTAIATDDLHYPGYEAFRGWTMVYARERTREAVLDALRTGRFYSTTGPRFESLTVVDGVLTVHCTPVRSVTVLGNPPYGGRITAGHHELTYRGKRLPTADGQTVEGLSNGEFLTGAIFGSHPRLRYARVVIEDVNGRRAWSNPIYLDSGAF